MRRVLLMWVLGSCLEALGRLETAASLFSRCLSRDPGNPVHAYHRGACLLRLGNFRGACCDFDLAVSLCLARRCAPPLMVLICRALAGAALQDRKAEVWADFELARRRVECPGLHVRSIQIKAALSGIGSYGDYQRLVEAPMTPGLEHRHWAAGLLAQTYASPAGVGTTTEVELGALLALLRRLPGLTSLPLEALRDRLCEISSHFVPPGQPLLPDHALWSCILDGSFDIVRFVAEATQPAGSCYGEDSELVLGLPAALMGAPSLESVGRLGVMDCFHGHDPMGPAGDGWLLATLHGVTLLSLPQSALKAMAAGSRESAESGIEDMLHFDDSLEDFRLSPVRIKAAQGAWSKWLILQGNAEAAGDAIFHEVFEAAPSIAKVFTNPQAAQNSKFIAGLNELVTRMDKKDAFMDAVETFSFQHMNFDISPAGFMIFKGAILDAMEHDLQTDFSLDAKDGLSGLVNYVGAAMLFIRKGCALRAQLLSSSWQESHDRGNGKSRKTEQAQAEEEEGDGEFSPGGIRPERRSGDSDGSGSSGNKSSGSSGNRSPTNGGMKAMSMNLPTSFTEMFTINATVMGFGKGAATWMGDCLESFDAIVAHLGSAGRLQEECRTLVLRLSLYDKSIIVLPQFKACLLAALRSTLPKTWTTDHEEAWTWLWDNIVRILEATLDKIPIYEEALQTALSSFSPRQRYKVRSDMYTRFFALCPVGQNFFKQSNTRLHFIADRVLSMTAEWFKDPKGMVSELSALGLKHVGFGIPTELFTPFVTATVQVMRSYRADETIVEAFQWALILTANVLVRTILEGSTVVMKAVNMNSIKSLKTAVAAAPRGERATWLLHIQVGDQFISPLLWALENGSVHVAEAVLKDLLTIRADRARYYFGADTLFEKHPDIVKRLSDRAPQLLPVLLDGLVWRSHRTLENGQKRRVNYFVRHMLIASGGEFSPAIKWISSSG
ncbi:unnamed protein product, partial [Polarella glacialis]